MREEMIRDGEKPIAIRQEIPSETPGISRLELIKQARRLATEAVENTDADCIAVHEELAARDPAAAIRNVAAYIASAAASKLLEAL